MNQRGLGHVQPENVMFLSLVLIQKPSRTALTAAALWCAQGERPLDHARTYCFAPGGEASALFDNGGPS
jgi:hypothetical protein